MGTLENLKALKTKEIKETLKTTENRVLLAAKDIILY